MSRASYNSLADKYRVDAKAANNLALAQTLSEDVGRQKAQAARDRQLNIIPPPARYQSAAEATADYAHANQQAMVTLETFMYPKDAANAFGELLKNDQITEFNQYAGNFKKALGDQTISYVEFINYWQIFIEQLHENINSNVLYLPADEKDEYIQNEAYNQELLKNNDPEDQFLPIKREAKYSTTVLRTPKPSAQKHQDELKTIFASNADIDSMKIGKLRTYITQTLNPAVGKLHEITHLRTYTAETVQKLRDKVKATQGSVHARVNSSVRKQASSTIAKAVEASINRKKLEARIKHRKQASSSTKLEAQEKQHEIGVLKAEIDRLSRQWSLTPDYDKGKKDKINDTIRATKAKLDALKSSGAGINHKRLIHGRGLTQPNMIHRFKVLQGEVLAGNDNPEVINELQQLITKLKSTGILVVI